MWEFLDNLDFFNNNTQMTSIIRSNLDLLEKNSHVFSLSITFDNLSKLIYPLFTTKTEFFNNVFKLIIKLKYSLFRISMYEFIFVNVKSNINIKIDVREIVFNEHEYCKYLEKSFTDIKHLEKEIKDIVEVIEEDIIKKLLIKLFKFNLEGIVKLKNREIIRRQLDVNDAINGNKDNIAFNNNDKKDNDANNSNKDNKNDKDRDNSINRKNLNNINTINTINNNNNQYSRKNTEEDVNFKQDYFLLNSVTLSNSLKNINNNDQNRRVITNYKDNNKNIVINDIDHRSTEKNKAPIFKILSDKGDKENNNITKTIDSAILSNETETVVNAHINDAVRSKKDNNYDEMTFNNKKSADYEDIKSDNIVNNAINNNNNKQTDDFDVNSFLLNLNVSRLDDYIRGKGNFITGRMMLSYLKIVNIETKLYNEFLPNLLLYFFHSLSSNQPEKIIIGFFRLLLHFDSHITKGITEIKEKSLRFINNNY